MIKCKNYLQLVTREGKKGMKVALVCESPLLKKSLELYLKGYVSSYGACDFVISDRAVKSKKPVLFIGKVKDASLRVPFSKKEVLSKAQQFYLHHLHEESDDEQKALDQVLAQLNKKHKEKIEKIIREFHDPR